MAKLCRNVCSVAGLEMPAICFADVNARFSWRDEIGLILGLPGNNQPSNVNQTVFTGDQKAWKVSDEQRKIREPFFNRSEGARGAFGAGE